MGDGTEGSNKWYCEIVESENEINVFCNKETWVDFIETNAPILAGTIELDAEDHKMVTEGFAEDDVIAIGVSWNKYCEVFGFAKVQ